MKTGHASRGKKRGKPALLVFDRKIRCIEIKADVQTGCCYFTIQSRHQAYNHINIARSVERERVLVFGRSNCAKNKKLGLPALFMRAQFDAYFEQDRREWVCTQFLFIRRLIGEVKDSGVLSPRKSGQASIETGSNFACRSRVITCPPPESSRLSLLIALTWAF